VVFTFEMMRAIRARPGGLLQWYSGIEKIDDYTVRLSMSHMYRPALETIGEYIFIVPEQSGARWKTR
jgi:ABC-type transport system substrate-binding protein